MAQNSVQLSHTEIMNHVNDTVAQSGAKEGVLGLYIPLPLNRIVTSTRHVKDFFFSWILHV